MVSTADIPLKCKGSCISRMCIQRVVGRRVERGSSGAGRGESCCGRYSPCFNLSSKARVSSELGHCGSNLAGSGLMLSREGA